MSKVNIIVPMWRSIPGEGGNVRAIQDDTKARECYEAMAKNLDLNLNDEGYVEDDNEYGTTVLWYVVELE